MRREHIHVPGNELTPFRDYDFYIGKIIPKFIIKDGVPEHIIVIDESFHLGGFIIKRLNNKLDSVKIFGKHPNADLNTDELCLSEEEIGATISDIECVIEMFLKRLKVFYLDEAHFLPSKRYYKTEPVDSYTKIDVHFEKGEIYECEPPFRRLYPK